MAHDLSTSRLPILFVLLMVVFAAKDWLIMPPPPPATAQAGEFDTSRAIGRLERILDDQRPHSVDTPANDAVRARLMAELRTIGLQPQVHEASDCRASPHARVVSCSHVRNVIASIGPAHGKRLLLNAHYDSTPTGPGASDDGIGVASLLEIAAQMQRMPPTRPVTFLFNEGEEFGLNGASAFAAHDPLAREVDSLINIESRGVSGPATMFETSMPNGGAIADYARATRRPSANSISTDMASLIPNTTDVEEFKARHWKTLSYAIIGNETRYHTPGDTVASLDRASVYQMGSEVLGAARVMADSPQGAGGRRMVFTDVASRLLIRLPLIAAAVALAALLGGSLVVGWRSAALGRPLLTCAVAWAGGIAAAGLVATILNLIRPGDFWRAEPLPVYLAIYAVVMAAEAALLVRLRKMSSVEQLRTASWCLTLLVGGVASLILPGATIFFIFAAALALSGLLLMTRAPRASVWLLRGAALIQLLLIAQMLGLIEMLLVGGPLWALAPLAGLAALPILVEGVAGTSRRSVASLAVLALLGCGVALLVPRTSASRPGRLTIDYLRDDAGKRADWSVSNGLAPLPEALQRFGPWREVTLRNTKTKRWLARAPVLSVPTPGLTMMSATMVGKGRRIVLRLHRGGYDTIALRFAEAVPVTAMGLAGEAKPISSTAVKGATLLRCAGRSCDGLMVELRLASRQTVPAELIGTRFALPAGAAPIAAARPATHIPQYAPNSTQRIVSIRL